MQAEIKLQADFDENCKEHNCIWLLQTIKSIMYTFEGQTYIFDATCNARITLELYCQGDGQALSDFYTNFKSLIEAFEHYRGAIRFDKGLID